MIKYFKVLYIFMSICYIKIILGKFKYYCEIKKYKSKYFSFRILFLFRKKVLKYDICIVYDFYFLCFEYLIVKIFMNFYVRCF